MTTEQLNAAVAPKANSADVTAGLGLKGDTATVAARLTLKANAANPTLLARQPQPT